MRYTPFDSQFFSKNRETLIQQIDVDSIVLLQSSEQMVRNNDQYYSWRQDSNFFYLTGLEYPGCSLLIVPSNPIDQQVILFIPPIDPEAEKWDGAMLTPQKAENISGIKNIETSDILLKRLYRIQRGKEVLYGQVNDVFPNQALTAHHLFLQNLRDRLPNLQFKSIITKLAKLRVNKQPEEIQYIRKAIQITGEALADVARILKPGLKEYEIEALLTYHYIKNGCSRLAFDSIVAAGKNAAILHYVSNSNQINNGDVVLIDTGGEYGMYSSDITRVFPAQGCFNERQKYCYETVLQIQKNIVQSIQPGLTYKKVYELADQIQGEILAENGFIDDPKNHKQVSVHRVGHHLGLDVHDPGDIEWKLEPGSVITVEPGLYLPNENIGIRIEDDILITENSVEILSKAIPKEVQEIEILCGGLKL